MKPKNRSTTYFWDLLDTNILTYAFKFNLCLGIVIDGITIPTILWETSRTTNPQKDLRSLEPMVTAAREQIYSNIFFKSITTLEQRLTTPRPKGTQHKSSEIIFSNLFIYLQTFLRKGGWFRSWLRSWLGRINQQSKSTMDSVWLNTSILHFSRTPISWGKLNNIQFVFEPIHL